MPARRKSVAHHLAPQRRVTNQHGDVDRRRATRGAWPGNRAMETASCRPGPTARVVMPCEICVTAAGSVVESLGGMIVRIDHARGEHQAGAIDHAVVGARCDGPDLDDRIAHEPDVGASQRSAGAVGELGADESSSRSERSELLVRCRVACRRARARRERSFDGPFMNGMRPIAIP